MIRILIAAADQGLAQQIQSAVLEMGDSSVPAIATTTRELVDAVVAEDPDVVVVHEELGPEPVLGTVRDLGIRRPATAFLLVAQDAAADLVSAAMEAGARGLLPLPLAFGQVDTRARAAAAWSQHMRRIMGASPLSDADEDRGRARVVGIAGAKGGVGATTVAVHLALDVARTVTALRVCLVDLDLEKGDVPGLLEVRHRIGIADLAKVASDLSPGTVDDAMTHHDSGVDMLLAPAEIRDVEAVTPRALRQVLAALRRSYDLVLIDLGSHPTPAQATAVEMTDELVLVVTPDVAALRGMRRTINAWESLGVAKENEIRVLVNRSSKQLTVSPDTVRQLTKAQVLPVALKAQFRRLEPAINARDPLQLRSPEWWADLRRVGREIELVPRAQQQWLRGSDAPAAANGSAPPRPAPAEGGDGGPAGMGTDIGTPLVTSARKSRRGDRGDAGQVSVEAVGILPVLGLVVACLWFMAAYGVSAVMQSHAATAAARELSLNSGESEVRQAALDALPGSFDDHLSTVDVQGDLVTVTFDVVGGLGDVPGLPDSISTTRRAVSEP